MRGKTTTDRLDELKGTIKAGVGRVIGSKHLESGGTADLLLARARRKTAGVVRRVGGTLRHRLDQMADDERLARQKTADRVRGEAEPKG
jgi:uncharacterized protein YjbJ (UPF0337 family)